MYLVEPLLSRKLFTDFFSKLIRKALGKSSLPDNNHNRDDASDLDQQDSLPHDINKNNENNDNSIPQRRTSSTTSRNLRQIVSILTTNKDEENNEEESHTKRDEKNGDLTSITKDEVSNRQESVSSNWSDNIPVITISKIEHGDIGKQQKVAHFVDTDESRDSAEKPSHSQFKPKVKYALRKQNTEIDEESIRHFHKNIMKQRSLTLVHDNYREDHNLGYEEQEHIMNGSSQNQNKNKFSPLNDETKVSFRNIDSNYDSLDRKDSVFY